MKTLREEIQEEYTKAIILATKKGEIDLMFTHNILKLIEKKIDENITETYCKAKIKEVFFNC